METTEKPVYKKLFNIHYKDKTFTIFIDKYGRKTFLELTSSSEYLYPLVEDFIVLHKIYNERNPFISYFNNYYSIGSRLPIYREPKVTFKEFARYYIGGTAYLLAIVTTASIISTTINSRTLKLAKEDNKIEVVAEYLEGSLITNTNQLDDVLGYQTITKDEVINAINSNKKISDYYKKYAIELVSFLKNKYPSTDARIFYENIKNMTVLEIDEIAYSKHAAGTYNSSSNITSIRLDHKNSRQVILHEFAHAYHHWKEDTYSLPKYRIECYGHSLDEAMTNKIISGMVKITTYSQEKKVLDYLLSFVEYDYYDYEREGISKLISSLKEKYPNVDIDYIINSVDAMNETYFNTGEYIKIEATPEVLNELFNICACTIDLNSSSVYQPFVNFLKLIDYDKYKNIAEHYLNEYNNILMENGYNKEQLQSDINDFTISFSISNEVEENLQKYLETINSTNIPPSNIYQPFKDYLEAECNFYNRLITAEESYNLYFNLLETYNDFLYRNGYTRKQTITSEMARQKIAKYQNIEILGYCITKDDTLHPIIGLPKKDRVYDLTKVPILNNQGAIVLIDNNDVLSQTQYSLYQNIFIANLFKKIDQESITFDESTWQDIFKISDFEYKKVAFNLNGNKLTEEYLYNVSITIGQKQNGTNTFSLSSESQSIYQDEQTLKEVSIPLMEYLGDIPYKKTDMTSIEISDYLNEDYLKRLIAGDDLSSPINLWYDNLTYDIENDVVNVHPAYYVTIDEDGTRLKMNHIFLERGTNKSHIWINGNKENIEECTNNLIEKNAKIYLETVLDYYGILSEKQEDYVLSKSEVLELYNNYSRDIYINKDNNHINNSISSIKR